MHILLTIAYSHYCEKARWALDRSGLEYREESHLPLFHIFYNRKHQARRTVPALVTPQGVLKDSADILAYADQQGAELYPTPLRSEILSWEHRFNEVLGPCVRTWAYAWIKDRTDLLESLIAHGKPLERKLVTPLLPRLVQQIARMYRVYPGCEAPMEREINAIWQQTDHLLKQQPYLVGRQFTAADLTLAALGGILVQPPEYGFRYPELARYPEAMQSKMLAWRDSPTGQHILRLYSEYR